MILSDKGVIESILSGDERAVRHFFFERCTPIFNYTINQIFYGQVKQEELINELYLHLQENDWHKLRQFDYRSRLTTWLSVVAIRFFQKKRDELIESNSSEYLMVERGESYEPRLHQRMDVEKLINSLTNERHRFVIQKLILEDREPQKVADEMGITVDNLYNIKHRALQQLALIVRKDDNDDR